MPKRTAKAVWQGDLESGRGSVSVESGAFDDQEYTFASRFEEGRGTNPDELLGSSLASCYSMFLSSLLAKDGHPPTQVSSEARVHLSTEGGPHVARIDLVTEGDVPGIDAEAFQSYAERAKQGCPISKALAALEVHLTATLTNG